MSYLVEYEPEAFIDLEKLDPVVRERIITKIHWLAENFEQLTPQPLTGKFAGFYSYCRLH